MLSRRQFAYGMIVVAAGTAAASAGGLFGLFGPADAPVGRIYAPEGIALGGTDPVAYFTEGRPVPGDAAITADWAGATWRFSSAENRDRFLADPAAHAPQYGGWCAWAVAEHGSLAPTSPAAWSIVDGKLYLNYDANIQARWDKDRPGFISRADERWPETAANSS
ncbi:MAG: YHS domain-containing (seleno)protein [Pseudomonadota bacterium]